MTPKRDVYWLSFSSKHYTDVLDPIALKIFHDKLEVRQRFGTIYNYVELCFKPSFGCAVHGWRLQRHGFRL